MKSNPWAFGIIFLIIVVYLMFNNFQIPNYFLFEKTEKTEGVITNIEWTYGIRGHQLQSLTYEYTVSDSTHSEKFKGGMGYDYKKVGNKLLIKYSVEKPKKNKVIGQFKTRVKN